MRVINPNNEETHVYVGKCKNNEAPKHVTLLGEKKKIKLDGKNATMFDSPKSKDYLYVKVGSDWLWIKDKSMFAQDAFTTTKVTRVRKIDENNAPAATEDIPSHTGTIN